MARTFTEIKNGRVILPGGIPGAASVFIDNGKITGVGRGPSPSGTVTIDARGLYVSPGFIDTHIHGDPAEVIAHEIKYGTTAIIPAISCSSPAALRKKVNAIREFKKDDPLGAMVLGLRLEGPYINKSRAGAQDRRYILPPSESGLRAIIKQCAPLLKIVTLAPELEGSREIIGILCKHRIIASAGHSDANYREAAEGIDAGITHATHLFNGMRRISPSDAGVAGACLTDKRVTIEIILDMIHVSPARLCLALAMKNRDSVILITDSVRAEARGRKPAGGVYRLADGAIAGSNLTMIGAVKNAVRHCGVPLADAVKFAAANPARLAGVYGTKGSIEKGKDADLILFDKDFDVKMTMVRGKIMYQKRGFI
ncbi:MAG: N-acetylglucosamine-6-phosphate deacetylase [Candidatus Omnitrophica bacterium]|nr:N-acetylglucosamine-6-phosphate deacetylase [Candidatus Omnitrophota bacterium]